MAGCSKFSISLATSALTLGSSLVLANPASAQSYGMCGTGSGRVDGEAEFKEFTLKGTQEEKLAVTTEVETEVEVEVEAEVEAAVVGVGEGIGVETVEGVASGEASGEGSGEGSGKGTGWATTELVGTIVGAGSETGFTIEAPEAFEIETCGEGDGYADLGGTAGL